MKEEAPHVVVIGAGFGGLNLVRELNGKDVRVTLVDRHNYHLFQPLLYQVATAGVSTNEIAYPVRTILRKQHNAAFSFANADRIDLQEKCVVTHNGSLHYDYLVLAPGGRTNFFGLDTVEKHGFGLKNIENATQIRNHILKQFEKANSEQDPQIRKAMLTFVVAGGGPTGVECSGAISELVRVVLRKDYPNMDIESVRVVLVERMDTLLPGMASELGRATIKALQDKEVEVILEQTVAGYDGEEVTFKDAAPIPTRTMIWAAGIRASSLIDTLPVEKGKAGTVIVSPTLQIPDYPEVFVIGDAAYVTDKDGNPLPMVAPVAIQEASTTAQNLIRLIKGQKLKAFKYQDPGMMATIGRSQAVAQLGRYQFTGFIAWVIWLLVHIMQLIGFRNRIIVLINWAWDYFLYERAVRIIGPD